MSAWHVIQFRQFAGVLASVVNMTVARCWSLASSRELWERTWDPAIRSILDLTFPLNLPLQKVNKAGSCSLGSAISLYYLICKRFESDSNQKSPWTGYCWHDTTFGKGNAKKYHDIICQKRYQRCQKQYLTLVHRTVEQRYIEMKWNTQTSQKSMLYIDIYVIQYSS